MAAPKLTVLVTGAAGFVGRALCRELTGRGWRVRGSSRSPDAVFEPDVEPVVLDFSASRDLERALHGVTAVVHAAARVHVMKETARDALSAFRQANVEATRALAVAARESGVRQFVYLSSAKVHGEGRDTPYNERDPLSPGDPYAVSKVEAETTLPAALGNDTALTIIRPPLIYGPRVGGNFRRLLDLARLARRLPLPLGRISNRRSLLFVENLSSAIAHSLDRGERASGTWLLSDGEDLSTSALLQRLGAAQGGAMPLLPCPTPLVRAALRVLRKGAEADRLFGSFTVDSRAFRSRLDWTAPFTLADGIERTSRWFQESRND